MLLKARGRHRKVNIHRGAEQETKINDNVVWWQSLESCSPLVVSPSTNSDLKRVNFVWIGFNLPIRQYETGSVLWVFSILPQENCVKFYKCTSHTLYISAPHWQPACSYKEPTKPWTEWFDHWEMSLQKRMTTENKNKVIHLRVLRNCLYTVLKWYISNCLKGLCILFHANFYCKWLQSTLKMWQMESIRFWDSFAYTSQACSTCVKLS